MTKLAAFRRRVRGFYEREGRHALPWRTTRDPYRILVSEVMLQQTQVERVIPKYEAFLKRFPTARSLAKARLGDVLRLWQGLGYNRRAKLLHDAAKVIASKRSFPRTLEELRALPGVGTYTAAAVMTFAFDEPVPLIETNVRTVFIHHFFADEDGVDDDALMPLIERTLDRTRPREWYYALMDYGSHLKKTVGNASARSVHHVRQSAFKGSDREVRGAIVRTLAAGPKQRETLHASLPFDLQHIDEQLERLIEEGMVVRRRAAYALP
ncbi:MAG TPA: A/G-specific adenine glycosylase [Candidatus Paceibacterota bacterium]|nr:A/G-specific adenine glycosylase [Candidatus Paceibacterota bacterium]